MSRLIGYGTGEVVDRLTILELKLLHGKAAGKDVGHFWMEAAELQARLLHHDQYFQQALQLAAVNAALWAAEDALRKWRTWWGESGPGGRPSTSSSTHGYNSETVHTVAQCGLRIQELNDQRAALVAQINTLAGDAAGAEKL